MKNVNYKEFADSINHTNNIFFIAPEEEVFVGIEKEEKEDKPYDNFVDITEFSKEFAKNNPNWIR
jgi:hypothetical protein